MNNNININTNKNTNSNFINNNENQNIKYRSNKKKKEKKIIFKKLNIKIKIAENLLEKEITVNLENDNKEDIVNNIIEEYNLDGSYYEPLLNILENTIELLNNFDKIRPATYGMRKIQESKGYNLLFGNKNYHKENNLNDSFIIELIENNTYKNYINSIIPDISDTEKYQNRNFSFSYKRK